MSVRLKVAPEKSGKWNQSGLPLCGGWWVRRNRSAMSLDDCCGVVHADTEHLKGLSYSYAASVLWACKPWEWGGGGGGGRGGGGGGRQSDVFAPTVFKLAGILHQPESKPNSRVYSQLNSTWSPKFMVVNMEDLRRLSPPRPWKRLSIHPNSPKSVCIQRDGLVRPHVLLTLYRSARLTAIKNSLWVVSRMDLNTSVRKEHFKNCPGKTLLSSRRLCLDFSGITQVCGSAHIGCFFPLFLVSVDMKMFSSRLVV